MKHIILIAFLSSFLLACTGDCLTCHPKLVPTINEDERHKPMLTCINCHSADPLKMADCGADCFACHSMKKIHAANVREHDVIQGCRDCHVGVDEKLLDISTSFTQSNSDSLKDYLLK
ncbi:hypothetical protein KJ877_05450 [bacterium]|nr:hypothetical protein [bacterium]MBU1990477.1 hypothetical protein [bacterium]